MPPRQFAAPATVMVRPLLLKPQWMNGVSERVLVSHYENNNGRAVGPLNIIKSASRGPRLYTHPRRLMRLGENARACGWEAFQ